MAQWGLYLTKLVMNCGLWGNRWGNHFTIFILLFVCLLYVVGLLLLGKGQGG